MGLGKLIGGAAAIFTILLALAIWLLPWWAWLILIILFIAFALLCVFTPLGPALLAILGTAAETAGAAAEAGLLSRIFGGGNAPAGQQGTRGPGISSIILPLILIGGLGTAIYLVLAKLGLNTMTSRLVILLIILLGVWHKLNPKGATTALKAAAISAFGIMAVFLLSTLPGKSHIFVMIFIVFFLIGTLAVAGAGTFALVLIILVATGFAAVEFAPSLVSPGTPIDSAIKGQQQAWSSIVQGTSSFITGAQKGVERQILVATGNYEQGVEAQQQRPLGVFLDNIDTTSDSVAYDQEVDVFATLRAETFKTEQPLNIELKCCKFSQDGCQKNEGTITPSDSFSVEEYDSISLDCIIEPTKLTGLEGGPAQISLEAQFTFTTDSFIKTYFMHQDTIRSYRREQTDPLDAFKITDKNPTAVFTPGPMRIGIGVGTQPVAVVTGTEFGPSISVTFERNWQDGQIVGIERLVVTAPPGIELKSVDGKPLTDCTKTEQKEHECTITGDMLAQLFPPEELKKPFKTIRVQTGISSTDELLGQAPLAIRSFKVRAEYTFKIHKETSVTITKPQRTA